jgi:CoA:oxalate CoA-transferase
MSDNESTTSLEPLTGITVLEMSVALQGPAAGLYLRDMGADVIKIEPPEGDAGRYHRGVNNTTPADALGPGFIAANRGKKSVSLDIHSAEGRAVVERLLAKADVFLSNYRESFLEKLGLDYETLAPKYPQLVYAHVNGFGPQGPDKDKAMLDGVAQARGGLISLTGVPGETPLLLGAAVADLGGAMHLALGVMTGLFARAQHGKGQKVTTSALGTMLWLQQWELQQRMITGKPLTANGSHVPNMEGPYGVYDTKDGGSFMFANAMGEESWDAFCIFCELFELIGDKDWDTPGKRLGGSGVGQSPEAVRALFKEGFARKTTKEWIDFMYSQPELILERVRSHDDVLTDEQNIANEYIVPMTMPIIGDSRVVGNLVRLSETPGSVKGPAPVLGDDTAAVMTDLGFDNSTIDAVTERAATIREEIFQAIADS